LQTTPEDFDIDELVKELKDLSDKILDIHGVHLWTLDGENNVMTFHMVVEEGCGLSALVDLKRKLKHFLEHKGISDVNIDIENLDNCSDEFGTRH
jgi:cobalt-zinc-cadmium efflux system protein